MPEPDSDRNRQPFRGTETRWKLIGFVLFVLLETRSLEKVHVALTVSSGSLPLAMLLRQHKHFVHWARQPKSIHLAPR